MDHKLLTELINIVTKECVKTDALLSEYTTFKIGGPADYLVFVNDADKLSRILKLCTKIEMPYYILGKGSNLLVSDKGYRGVVIKLVSDGPIMEVMDDSHTDYKRLVETYHIDTTTHCMVKAPAAVSLIQFGLQVAKLGLTGFEFATGVPGTLGGALAMNAGAYGQEIKDTLLEITVVEKNGEVRTLSKEELELGYRKCIIQDTGAIAIDATFAFPYGKAEEVRAKVVELTRKRQEKQPLEYPSAGSTFKRPEGYFAGKLIMDAGLRGYRYNGAQVSEKHCGFVINAGNATAQDVIELIKYVQKEVFNQYGVNLETEVKFLGEF